jgi:V/A-type H+-transporting ATPase subunit K
MGTVFAGIGAIIALGGTGIASMIGLKSAGVSAAGAVAENKDNFTNSLVLQALPQTQVVYGFITALFIAMGAGLLGATTGELSNINGLVMMVAGILVAITGLSGIFQGMVSSAGIASCAKNSEAFVPSVVFGGQVETPAIFGFICALIILVVGLQVLG